MRSFVAFILFLMEQGSHILLKMSTNVRMSVFCILSHAT